MESSYSFVECECCILFKSTKKSLTPMPSKCTSTSVSISSIAVYATTSIRSICVLTRCTAITPITYRTFIYICNRSGKKKREGLQHAQSVPCTRKATGC